jgi:hypothetical protein
MRLAITISLFVSLFALACGRHTAAARNMNVVRVNTTEQLKQALLFAKPGDEIVLADGMYTGRFVINTNVNGTAEKPIVLRGSRKAILDGGTTSTGYVLHLQSSYWVLKGFTITNGLKGLMADGSSYSLIEDLKVYNIGEEAIHLRKFSSHNTIQNCDISYTGLKTPDYGEGLYIGSAKNHWDKYGNGKADLCDSNKLLNNKIGPYITAECIDIKEGTTGGLIKGNSFDATGITGANSGDSWIDVKGNYYIIEENKGFNPQGSVLKDGYQVHCVVNGWGNYNEFKNNNCAVNAPGYGFNISLTSSNGNVVGTKVYSSNVVTGAAKGISNIALID